MCKKEDKKQNNSLQRRLRATFLVGVMILLGVFFTGMVSASWTTNSTINNSLLSVGAPGVFGSTTFYKDNSWYMISGNESGIFLGFVWNGNGWTSNSTINGSLVDVGLRSSPTVFQMNGNWYLISGEDDGVFNGYTWNGANWIANTTIIAGLPDIGSRSFPRVFYKDVSWYLISGTNGGSWYGYVWNGAGWNVNLTINASLPSSGNGKPAVFQVGTTWYLITGTEAGDFMGYTYNSSSMWKPDLTINASLPNLAGAHSSPNVFYKNDSWYMLANDYTDAKFWGFSMDGAPPEGATTTKVISVNLTSPANATVINTIDEDFIVNLSITGTATDNEWVNNTYYIWYNNGTLFNTTFVDGLSTNETGTAENIDNFTLGTYKWNTYACYSNATFGNCSWATNNYTFNYVPFTNTGENYSLTTYETDDETFYLNITTISGASKMGAFLVYNGTFYAASHTCVGSNCQIWRKIDIPLMTTTASSENKSFYWQITVFGTFGTSTSTTTVHNQNVSNLLFNNGVCSASYNASINFTIYNETDRNLIVSGFKSRFNFWLGDGTVKDTYNFTGNGANNYLFCINHNMSYITNSYITINASSMSRIYQFVKEIYTNVLRVQKLFIPDNSYSNIIIEVKNQGLVPQKDISVNISRYYPEIDTYEVVEHQTTDEYGQITAKLVQNDVKYKFSFYDSSNILLKTSDLVTVICRSSICVIPFVIETTNSYLEQYDTLPLFDYSLTFDNTTNIFSYSWDDQRGESSTHRLEVVRYAFNESTIVCNTTSTTTVSSLTCAVGNNPASYTAQVFRKVNGQTEIRIDNLQTIVGDYSAKFEIEGLFWVFILLFTCIGIGVYDPKVGAILYGVGFIFMGIIKIIYMPLPVFFANTILVILFVWAIKT